MPHRAFPTLLRELGGYVVPDDHGDPEMGYRVHSVYWDSPALRFFWEKIEGVMLRRKLRFRRYGEADTVFLEIKQRVDRTVQKRRIAWPLAKYQRVFETDGQRLEVEPEDPVASEVAFLIHHYELAQRVAISYRRLALFGIFEPDLRITIDRRVKYHPRELSVVKPFDTGRYVVDPRLLVMEVKFNERVPIWLQKLVSYHRLQAVRLSKYCSAIDREYFQSTLT